MIRIVFTALVAMMASSFCLQAQNIDHWEALVLPEQVDWRYHVPTSEPAATWTTVGFDDSSWSTGPGGFGYGDGDDNTTLSAGISVYLRKTFTVTDIAAIEDLRFFMDYDDGFVAHLNGVEFARSSTLSNGGTPVPYDEATTGEHEAVMYQGNLPEEFADPMASLQQGQNVLSIQVHNWSANSSDMSAIPFLLAGINSSNYDYSSTPPWFVPDFALVTNLPMVIINTGGVEIPDDFRILAEFGIIDNGPGMLNSYDDPWNEYNGIINIEQRGSTSGGFPKKSYAFETQDAQSNPFNASFLSLPTENDWVLYAPYSDKSLMRNVLAYDLAMEMGITSSRTRWCEVVIDGNYKGIYVMMEQIKWDENRVDVPEMDVNDNTGDDLTGGYIVKVDKATGGGVAADWDSNIQSYNGQPKDYGFQYDYPKRDVITPQQENYIQSFINDMETALAGPMIGDPSTGYRKYLDIPSMIDYFLILEFTREVDAYRLSTYMAKQRDSRGGKLFMGPLWDQNLGFGNADYCDGASTSGWAFQNCVVEDIPFWWEALLADAEFLELVQCRWLELRQHTLEDSKILQQIDDEVAELDTAVNRNFERWPILGQYVWPNSYVGNTHAEEITFLKNWMMDRLEWIDNNIGNPLGTCSSDLAQDIVVSEINYNDGVNYPTDDWFELHNTGSQDIDLSFSTIKDLNNFNTFTFPMGTQLLADSFLVVARDLDVFSAFHPTVTNVVQGSFNWGLSSTGDRMRMWDVDGLLIYDFVFGNTTPWPINANGNGPTMEWNHSQTEQHVGTNWFEGCFGGSPGTAYYPCTTSIVDHSRSTLNVYPNPTNGVITFSLNGPSANVSLVDVQGRVVADLGQMQAGIQSMDLRDFNLNQGLYFINVTQNGSVERKPIVFTAR